MSRRRFGGVRIGTADVRQGDAIAARMFRFAAVRYLHSVGAGARPGGGGRGRNILEETSLTTASCLTSSSVAARDVLLSTHKLRATKISCAGGRKYVLQARRLQRCHAEAFHIARRAGLQLSENPAFDRSFLLAPGAGPQPGTCGYARRPSLHHSYPSHVLTITALDHNVGARLSSHSLPTRLQKFPHSSQRFPKRAAAPNTPSVRRPLRNPRGRFTGASLPIHSAPLASAMSNSPEPTARLPPPPEYQHEANVRTSEVAPERSPAMIHALLRRKLREPAAQELPRAVMLGHWSQRE